MLLCPYPYPYPFPYLYPCAFASLQPCTSPSPSQPCSAQVELAPIQAMLPDELLLIVLSHVNSYTLGSVACVCRHWRALVEHPRLWEAACTEAFRLQYPDKAVRARRVVTQYR